MDKVTLLSWDIDPYGHIWDTYCDIWNQYDHIKQKNKVLDKYGYIEVIFGRSTSRDKQSHIGDQYGHLGHK